MDIMDEAKGLLEKDGVAGLAQKFKDSGLDEQVSSWISTGENIPVVGDRSSRRSGTTRSRASRASSGSPRTPQPTSSPGRFRLPSIRRRRPARRPQPERASARPLERGRARPVCVRFRGGVPGDAVPRGAARAARADPRSASGRALLASCGRRLPRGRGPRAPRLRRVGAGARPASLRGRRPPPRPAALLRAVDGPAAAECYAAAQDARSNAPVVYGAAFRRAGRIDCSTCSGTRTTTTAQRSPPATCGRCTRGTGNPSR